MKTGICNIEFKSCIMNAAGPLCTCLDELESIGKSESGAIVMKTCTLKPREGNPEPRIYEFEKGTLNSIGWANLGYKKYGGFIPRLKKYKKPIIASIGGFNEEEYATISKFLESKGVDMVELNLSCPNIEGFPPPAFNMNLAKKILKKSGKGIAIPMGVKVPPYLDPVFLKKIAGTFLKCKIDFVTCVNSAGNSLIIDAKKEKRVIAPEYGGLTGASIKPIALGNISLYHRLFKGKIPIIGVGGIFSGEDAFEHLLAGASAVQLGTAYLREGPAVFRRIDKELNSIMESKGYNEVSAVTGKI
ncbi:dihydroorotate oxidase [Candidatus Woesearchaeota archaeon]|nr:dihydroorotate oxidase [Candidatus Woesearchaeota archaeon]